MVPRSTMKPRILPSSFAQTMARSAIGAFEIHILAPLSLKPPAHLLGARHHRARIGAEVRLGQAEAADQLGLGELGQIFLLLRLGAVGVDRMHHQRRLHRERRAIAGIDALHLARDQAIGDVAQPRAAVFLRDGRAEQAERAHLGQQFLVDLLLAPGEPHPRHQLVLRERARAVAHHALFLGQVAVEIERILPVEVGILQHLGGLRRGFRGRGGRHDGLQFMALALAFDRPYSIGRGAPQPNEPAGKPAGCVISASAVRLVYTRWISV